ncbi:glycoside hydrolase family 1 protein [Dictyobacter kobayashii]|nr:family 1 glycosylhydrolase [Dictyobacter kobayashii]
MKDLFSLPESSFPAHFIWGSATAGHQIEGDNIHSQWWAWEQAGRFAERSGKACNSYALYKEDISLLQELGHQAYRFSIEWSRIEPAENQFDTEALAHYVDLARRVKEAGMKTFVTLHHFSHPQWFEEQGAFHTLDNLPFFERYVRYVVPALAPYTDFWIIINEFNLGNAPERLLEKANFIRYHARGYHLVKEYSTAPVSSAHAFPYYMPSRPTSDFDVTLTRYRDWIDHEFFFHAIRTGEIVMPFQDVVFDADVKGTCDYWAINYYTRHMIDARRASGEGTRYRHTQLKLIPMDFYLEEFFPEGIILNLERLIDKPVYITENGVASNDDAWRLVYLALHMTALKEAIDRGVDVRGYLYWSFLDNYEWGSFLPRFGLVDVDFTTFTRSPRPSAYFYRDVIEHNGFTPEMLRHYLPWLAEL